jgi:phosphoribosylformylglycinamidine synthase
MQRSYETIERKGNDFDASKVDLKDAIFRVLKIQQLRLNHS